MKLLAFADRNAKEVLRDPLSILFGLGFPLVLLLLMSAIQAHIPVDLFLINKLAPGVCVFGMSFFSLFAALLVAKDRTGAFLTRLYTTPLRAADFLLGYALPLVPLALGQTAVCLAVSLLLGLTPTWRLLVVLPASLPVAVFFISLGLLCGSVLNDKQVGGVCGALLTNLAGWLSGVWFDLSLAGGVFQKAADLLPFVHAVELERAVLDGRWADTGPHALWVAGYAAAALGLAVWLFCRQMKR